MTSRLPHLALGAAALAPLGAWSTDAFGQTYTVTSIAATGTVGNIASPGSGTTTLTLSPSGTFSPSGIRVSSGSVVYTVTVKCGSQNACNNAGTNVAVQIQDTGGATGRLLALQNFTAAAGTDTIITAPSGSNPTTLTIGPIGKNATKTFVMGFDIPITNSGSTGATTRNFQVLVAPTGNTPSNSGAGTMTATVFNPIAVGVTSQMAFGSIVKPSSGTSTVTLTTGGVVTATGSAAVVATSAHSAAGFSVTGEGGQAYSLTVPGTFVMNSGTNTLAVTTTTSFGSTSTLTTQTFTGALGAAGTFNFSVGGSFGISSATPSGAYTGNLVVSVNYN
jgi:hypothetical protein